MDTLPVSSTLQNQPIPTTTALPPPNASIATHHCHVIVCSPRSALHQYRRMRKLKSPCQSGISLVQGPEKPSRRPPVNPYLVPVDSCCHPTSPPSRSNIPSPANSMPLVTPPNREGDSAKTVSPAVSNIVQMPGDDVSPPYHHVHTRKSSSSTPAHPRTHTSTDTKHTSLSYSSRSFPPSSPPPLHSNVPSPANSMSLVTRLGYEGDNAETVPSAGSSTARIPTDNVPPPYHHVHTRKPSSSTPAHPMIHTSIDTKHTSLSCSSESAPSPLPPSSHSGIPFLAGSTPLITPLNPEGDSAESVSSADPDVMPTPSNGSLPYHHARTRKSSSPMPAHPSTQTSIYTKHTSLPRSSRSAPPISNHYYLPL